MTFFLCRQTSSFESLLFVPDVSANNGRASYATTTSKAPALLARAEDRHVDSLRLRGTGRRRRETMLIGVWWIHSFQTPYNITL